MRKNLLKAAVGAGSALAVLTAMGCSSESETPTPVTKTVTQPRQAAPAPEESDLGSALEGMDSDMTEEEVAAYANTVCDYIGSGASSAEVINVMMAETGEMDIMLHAGLVGLSVGSYCPEYADQVEDEWN